jgi:hypothetical protein
VWRDANGLFLGASALTVVGGLSPTTLEAMSCREGLSLAQDLGLPRICIASNCLGINIHHPYQVEYSMIIPEIKETTSTFAMTVFRHERRNSNGEPHRFAHSSVSLGPGRRLWLLHRPMAFVLLKKN